MSPKNFQEALAGAEVGGTQATDGIQVISILWRVSEDVDYLTLDEALGEEVLEITEVDKQASVPTIRVKNKSDRPVFMMAGELLIGCKQDRVLNTSILVPVHKEMQVPVTCVEAGRWRYRSRQFGSAGSSSHAALRRMMSKQSTGSYRRAGEARPSQASVWKEVQSKIVRLGSTSGTSALHDVFSDYSERLQNCVDNVAPATGANGVAVALDGQIVGAVLFDRASTLTKLWAKLLRGYALDAMEARSEGRDEVKAAAVSEWLAKASRARTESYDSPGLGRDVRIEGSQVHGAALVVEGSPLHLELFNESAE